MKLGIWASKYENDKKYLICDNYDNVENLLKKQTILINNLEATSLKDIALGILIKYNAKINKLEELNIINTHVQIALLNNLIREKEYKFIPQETVCEATLREILDLINVIRSAHVIDKQNKEIEKISEVINDYEKVLRDNNYIDDVLLYEDAIDILNNNDLLDNSRYAVLDYVKEKMTFLEVSLINALKKDIEIIEISEENKCDNYRLLNVYGEANAIEKVLEDIKEKGFNLGDCQILLTNTAYEANIKSVLESRNINYSYTSSHKQNNSGLDFINSYLQWVISDFSYDCFMKIINADVMLTGLPVIASEDLSLSIYLDQVGIDAGISYGIDRYYEFLHKIEDVDTRHRYFKSLYERNPYFKEDTIIDEAFDIISDYLEELLHITEDNSIYLPGLLLERIVDFFDYNQSYRENEATLKDEMQPIIDALKMMANTKSIKESILVIEDKLKYLGKSDKLENNSIQVSTLNSVFVFFRNNIYIIGMNYDDFEPKLRDNPIISNYVLRKCLDETYYIKLSLNTAKEKKDMLIKSLSTFSGNQITFIMSNYNTKEFRETIPSPIYNELKKKYKEELCEGKYENLIYLKNNERLKHDLEKAVRVKLVKSENKSGHIVYRLLKPLTASQLNAIMKCPLQYIYSLKYFADDYEKRNPYEWLNPAEKGNLFHYVFEAYCKTIINVKSSDLSENVYLDRFEKIFDEKINYFKEMVVCPNEKVFEMEKQEYHDQMLRYLEMMHSEFKEHHISVRKVEAPFEPPITKERTLSIDENGNKYSNGSSEELIISFKANTTIDREDYLEVDDEIRIVDYKTASSIFKDKKLNVNLQWFVYPFLEGAQRFEYHFPCVNNEEEIFGIKKKNEFDTLPNNVGKKLFDFFVKGKIDVLESDDEEDEDVCKYCSYKGICLKKLAIKRGELNDK